MKSKLFILPLLLLLYACTTTAQPYKEFKWKDSTGAGSIHVAVPMIPGSQMVITGTIDDPTVIMWNDTLLYIASKDYTAGIYATIANLALKKDKNDTTDATGFARVWQLGLSFQKGDTADATTGFFSRPYMTTLMGYKYDKGDTNSSTKGFYPREMIDAMLNAYYTRSDTSSTTKGFYTKQMVDALIAEAIVTSGSGTVTNVASGNGLTGGPITTTGTLKIDTTIKATAALTGFLGFSDFSSFALAATRASKFATDSSLYLQMDDTTAAGGILSKTRADNQYQVKGSYGTGTVTSVATGHGLTGGTITTTGTLLIDTTDRASASNSGILGFESFASFTTAATRAANFAADSGKYVEVTDSSLANGFVNKTRADNQYEVKGTALLKSTILMQAGVGSDSVLVTTSYKIPMGISTGIVIDTIVIVQMRTGGSLPCVKYRVNFGTDISGTGTFVDTTYATTYTTATRQSGANLEGTTTIPAGAIIWLDFPTVTVPPKTFLVVLLGHRL